MAYKTISATDVAKYPSMEGMLGKTVTAAEYKSLQRATAPAAAKAPARKRAAAKKAVAKKATAKKAAPRKR